MNTAIIKPQWGPLTIALMVGGFIVWWPLGFVVLAYIIWGEKFGGSSEKAEAWMNKSRSWCRGQNFGAGFSRASAWGQGSGNAAFDDYRAEQLRRLEEERRRLDEEIHEFHEYMRTLRAARDREEFDRFMNDRKSNRSNPDGNPTV